MEFARQNFKYILSGVFFLISVTIGYSQSITINTIVPTAPPPTTFEEILSFESKVIIQMTNITTDRLEVKLGMTLTNSDRAIQIALAEDFLPSIPIILESGESRNLRFSNLKASYGNLMEGDVILEGVDYEDIIRSERLPEGDYELCIIAQEYYTNEILSVEGSCGYFPVLEYEPPVVIFPDNEQIVTPTNPQNVLFQWTPTGDILKTKYRVQLVHASDYGFANPLDVFNYEDEVFMYELDNLRYTQFLYNQNHPLLIEDGIYSFRVQAYDEGDELNYVNDGWSAPIFFHYKNTDQDIGSFAIDESTSNSSGGECSNYDSSISTTSNSNVQVGQIVYANAFELQTTKLQYNDVSASYDGEGSIYIPFLNTNVKVAFSNIRINQDNRVFGDESVIYGGVDNSGVVSLSTSQEWDSPATMNFTPNFQSVIQNKVSGSGSTLDLPFRFENSEAVIVAFLLKQDQAKIKINLPISIPEISGGNDPYISFVNDNICIDTDGFQEVDINLSLSETINVPIINENMHLKLPDDENTATISDNGDYVLDLSGEVIFEKSIVEYKNSNGRVRIPFTQLDASGLDIMIPVNEDISNLVFPGLKDLRVAPSQIVIDFASNINASGFDETFSGYTSLWKGVYIQSGNIKLPKGLGGNNVKMDIDGMALSANGLSLSVARDENLINLSEGRVGSWPFSIDEFEVLIEEGEITKGEMAGSLRLPIQSGGQINYSALLSSSDDNRLNVSMNASPSDDIDVDMWLAKMNVDEASTIGLQKYDGKYRIDADLNGSLEVQYSGGLDLSISQVDIPSLEFQHLKISGQKGNNPSLDIGAVALEDVDEVQLSIQTFEATLEDWDLVKVGERYGLNFSLGISLFGGDITSGFGAGIGTEFDIWAKYQNGFKHDETDLKKIKGNLDLGIATASVEIDLFDDDETYGNGFRGEAGITLARVESAFEAGFVIQFGKVDGYRYWYFDGSYKSSVGIPLGNSSISIFGFGGGGYYNMEAVGPDEDELQRYSEITDGHPINYTNPAVSVSDFTYEPKKNGRGFRAMSVIGNSVSPSAWNVESNFLMDWETGFNIKNVVFDGKFNMMRAVDDDNEPPFSLFNSTSANMAINVSKDPQNGRRMFKADMELNLEGQFLASNIPLSFMYSSLPNGQDKQWHINLGSWSQADPFTDDSRISLSKGPSSQFFTLQTNIAAYLMMGNTFQNGDVLPPLPDDIINSASDSYGNGPQQRENDAASEIQNAMNGESESNFGIGMGLGMQMKFNLNVLMFYTDFSAEVVADFALKYQQQGCSGYNSVGFNEWYASGQAYGLVKGAVGVRGKLFGRNIEAHLIELNAGAAMKVQFPSPKRVYGKAFIGGSIFNGRIRIKPRAIEFEKGERCIPEGEFDPLENIKYVNEVIPNNNKKKVNVFVNPRIAFNISNGEILTFKDIEENTHIYKVDYTVRLKNKDSNQLLDISEHWSNNNQAYKMVPEAWLESKTNYEILVFIKAYEKIGGTFKEFESKTKKYTFKTANRPDYIVAEDMVQSYPGLGQRYFMVEKDEGSPILGFLELNKTKCSEILKEVDFNDQRDGYFAVFTNLRTRREKFVDCYCASEYRIEWEMPQHLNPNDIYRIELLARDFEGAFAATPEELEETWLGSSYLQANGVSSTPLYEQKTYSFVDKNTYTSHTKTKNLLDDRVGWYAETSKYRSYGEKLDKFSLHQVAYLPHNTGYQNPVTEGPGPTNEIARTFHIPFLLLRPNGMNEPFDRYDLVGYMSPIFGVGRIEPILNPTGDRILDYSGEYFEVVDDQLMTWEDPSIYMEALIASAPKWPRPSRYPYYGQPKLKMGLLTRWLRHYKRYERKLSNAGYNVNLWRPAKLIQPEEVQQLIGGHADDVGGMGFSNSINPTHGNPGGGLELQIYQSIDPVTTTTFASTATQEDRDLEGGIGGFYINNSYLPLVDWSSLMMFKDRVAINKHAIGIYNLQPENLYLHDFFLELETLDDMFRNLQVPTAEYKIKLSYTTGGSYDINYQYNRP